jgi:hypothetical protein
LVIVRHRRIPATGGQVACGGVIGHSQDLVPTA